MLRSVRNVLLEQLAHQVARFVAHAERVHLQTRRVLVHALIVLPGRSIVMREPRSRKLASHAPWGPSADLGRLSVSSAVLDDTKTRKELRDAKNVLKGRLGRAEGLLSFLTVHHAPREHSDLRRGGALVRIATEDSIMTE